MRCLLSASALAPRPLLRLAATPSMMMPDAAAADALSSMPIPFAALADAFSSLPIPDVQLASEPLTGGIFPGLLLLMTATSLFASCFGFGDAVIAIPMMALLFNIDAPQAAPLQTVVSSTLGILLLSIDALDGKMAQVGRWRESALLFVAGAAGVPLGVNALVTLDAGLLRSGVGVILVAYGVWTLFLGGGEGRESEDGVVVIEDGVAIEDDAAGEGGVAAGAGFSPLRALPFGMAAGSLCGAVGEPGPLAIVYGSTQRWDAPTMRGMLARFFLPVQLVTLHEFYERGLLPEPILIQAAATLPCAIFAVVIGTQLNRAFDPKRFSTAVDAIVVALGCLCLYSGYTSTFA